MVPSVSHWLTSVECLITQWDTQHRFVKKKKCTELYLHILIFNIFYFKTKLVNDCSDDNLIVVLWHFSDLGQSCVLPIVYTCSQVAKTTGVGIGSNTFKYLQIRTVIIAIFVRCVAPYSI